MRVFVFEHICGGGLSQKELSADLTPLGAAMLRSVALDFVAAGCEVTATLDTRVPMDWPGVATIPVEPGRPAAPLVEAAARRCDAALMIAPEFDGLLEGWAQRLAAWHVRSLGCLPESIRRCGDKLALAEHLQRHGIPTPPTTTAAPPIPPHGPHAIVAKPRCGAGCEDTFILHTTDDLKQLPDRRDWIYQPYVRGRPASAAFLVRGGDVTPLRAGRQLVTGESALSYRGGRLPLPEDAERRMLRLGERAVRSVPGLHGYVGVDLILGDTPETDAVIEINPRLTVAFAGLRRLCSTSLAAAMLDPAAPVGWHDGAVNYDQAGRCTFIPAPAGATT